MNACTSTKREKNIHIGGSHHESLQKKFALSESVGNYSARSAFRETCTATDTLYGLIRADSALKHWPSTTALGAIISTSTHVRSRPDSCGSISSIYASYLFVTPARFRDCNIEQTRPLHIWTRFLFLSQVRAPGVWSDLIIGNESDDPAHYITVSARMPAATNLRA